MDCRSVRDTEDSYGAAVTKQNIDDANIARERIVIDNMLTLNQVFQCTTVNGNGFLEREGKSQDARSKNNE